jgi:hypothetical protein
MKPLVVGPQPVGDLADRGPGDQQLAGRVAERVLHIPGRQPAGVHLGDQPVEHLAVAVQKAHQRRAERFTAATHLRHRHLDGTLRGASPSRLVAVTRPHLTLAPALIPAPAAQIVSLLGLQQFLHDQPGHRLHQHRDDIRLPPDTTGEQLMSCSRLITDGATLRIGLLLSSVLNTRHDRAGHLDLQAG